MIRETTIDSPVGPLTLVATRAALRAVRFAGERGEGPAPGGGAVAHPVLAEAARQLGEYFAGERTAFDLPLDPVGTPFQRRAWMALRGIPYGATVSYGEQARLMGEPGKARAVGAANGRNPLAIVVPCHRVVGSDGSLTGFGGGVDVKAWLLRHERARCGGAQPLALFS
ncbi:MAG: methylated-DNA--[protein]-cysteine S-methyltransferase [Actinomycetota bacterium]